MKIALDWDGTYTRNPQFWDAFITMCLNHAIDIRIVTARRDIHPIEVYVRIPVIYTNLKSKREHLDEIGWMADIFIDDTPEFIVRKDVLEFIKVFGPDEEPEG